MVWELNSVLLEEQPTTTESSLQPLSNFYFIFPVLSLFLISLSLGVSVVLSASIFVPRLLPYSSIPGFQQEISGEVCGWESYI